MGLASFLNSKMKTKLFPTKTIATRSMAHVEDGVSHFGRDYSQSFSNVGASREADKTIFRHLV